MVYKAEAIRERLKLLEEVISRLARHRGRTLEEYSHDQDLQWIVERGFILAAECVADAAAHILSGKFKIQPADQEDAIRRLAPAGVISNELAEALSGMGGFRNILVHAYLRIDPAKVHHYLENDLDHLQDFVAEVARWLSRDTTV